MTPKHHRYLLLSLLIRSVPLILLPFTPQTFFQPDEFYQALEPAHRLIFGTGYLTWEWRDLPHPPSSSLTSSLRETRVRADVGDGGALLEGVTIARLVEMFRSVWEVKKFERLNQVALEVWEKAIVRGRMRGWLWPLVFSALYKLLQIIHLDDTALLIIAPRVVGVFVAALTDYFTSLLASRILGPSHSSIALFLSLTSLFHAHALPRALSTSPETLLTVMALYYFPLTGTTSSLIQEKQNDKNKMDDEIIRVRASSTASLESLSHGHGKLTIAVMLAALSLCIRPTMVVFWAYLHLETTFFTYQSQGLFRTFIYNIHVLLAGLSVVIVSTIIDYTINHRLTFPFLTFIHRNIILNISTFYGGTDPFYHLFQSLPILLFPIWYWWSQGFIASLCPQLVRLSLPIRSPPALRQIARTIAVTIFVLSLSPHSEWRFLHPLLPPLLLFALPALKRVQITSSTTASPTSTASDTNSEALYQSPIPNFVNVLHSIPESIGIKQRVFCFILLIPMLPWLYLTILHGRAQVGVMETLRADETMTGLVVLMPCHSTPWMSHLHRDVPAWFLTCEPPIGVDPFDHRTQESLFYAQPISYLSQVFPYPPVPLHLVSSTNADPTLPSHLLFFGEILGRTETINIAEYPEIRAELGGNGVEDNVEKVSKSEEQSPLVDVKGETNVEGTVRTEVVSVREALMQLGYEEKVNIWNGFDLIQDEEKRRGGVRVWVRTKAEMKPASSW